MIRLDRYLSELGIGSRKEIKQLIRQGVVEVEGFDDIKNDMKIDEETAVVLFGGERLKYRKLVYLLMNKPQGVISATHDSGGEKTVIDILPDEYKYLGLFPVGRLDKDTEGLLPLTNDGVFAHRLISPKKNIEKVYYAVIRVGVGEREKAAFASGLTIDGGEKCRPASLMTLDEYARENGGEDIKALCRKGSAGKSGGGAPNAAEVIVKITEGKYHQVKRMFEAVGNGVLFLKRVAVGDYWLPYGLEEGAVEELRVN